MEIMIKKLCYTNLMNKRVSKADSLLLLKTFLLTELKGKKIGEHAHAPNQQPQNQPVNMTQQRKIRFIGKTTDIARKSL